MAPGAEDRFAAALRQAGLTLDAQDRAAALEVFRYLEAARERLRAEERQADGPG